MKNNLLIAIMFLYYCYLSGYITNIQNIRNETYHLDYDYYYGPINFYEDRLFVSSQRKIEEYQILPSGELNRVSFIETEVSSAGYINENKYYDIDTITALGKIKITVYSLDSSPMEKITKFSLDIQSASSIQVAFTENHLILTDKHNNRLVLINKTTYTIEDYLYDLIDVTTYSSLALSGSSLVLYNQIESGSNIIKLISFYDFFYNIETNSYDYEEKSEIVLDNMESIVNINIIDNTVIFTGMGGVVLIDITDLASPEIIYELNIDYQIYSALYNEDYIFLSTENGDLLVYDFENNDLIFSDSGYGAMKNNIYLQMPYLYIQKGYGTKVYNVSNRLDEICTYGIFYQFINFSLNDTDMYYYYATSQDIIMNGIFRYYFYSVFSDDLLFSFESEDISFHQFSIIEDTLIILVIDQSTQTPFLHIYEINSQQLDFVCSLDLSSYRVRNYYLHQNKIYFQTVSPYNVYVYELNDSQFSFIGSFSGKIPTVFSNNSNNYILNYNLNRIMVRDLNDYSNILLNQIVVAGSLDLFHYDENSFLLHEYGLFDIFPSSTYVYSFDLENPSVDLIYSGNTYANSFNRILTIHDEHAENVEFFTITNNQMNLIGGSENPYTQHTRYFFFPERNKLAIFSQSSIKTYDFNYTVSDSDETLPFAEANLLGNYPNPFNPSTTIKYTLHQGSNLRIDIYNIRGQKVKSLLNEYRPAGEHSIVWNGKDDNGNDVGNGVYFYRMEAEGYVGTKKMVILK